jgi:hypothetical protein
MVRKKEPNGRQVPVIRSVEDFPEYADGIGEAVLAGEEPSTPTVELPSLGQIQRLREREKILSLGMQVGYQRLQELRPRLERQILQDARPQFADLWRK